ncbi:hypothetical protein JOD54_004536 [Actinokineospora baliensis]|uniref:hypothetical protein n=1 Tax=Actinokineospora baliensis TaxID=547056 RepID=UPI00195D57E1|nr:hypothetical protein [Actinokineospora baliensis]MBM7774332.1 hypothetical protein [Actinokineospora baliensis]
MRQPGVERLPLGPERWLVDLPQPARRADGCPLSAILPPGYSCYLRLFSPFVPWEADRAATAERRTWRHFAEKAGVVYHAELGWNTLRPVLHPGDQDTGWEVDEGRMDPLVRDRLRSHLARHTTEPVFVYFGLAAEVLGSPPLLYRAPVEAFETAVEAASQLVGRRIADPEYIWPQARAWVVETDYDLTSSYLACDTALSAELLADDGLELLPATLHTRIDTASDTINRPR